MSFVKTVKFYPARKLGVASKHAFVMCGFGGSVWQTRRLLNVLRADGYDVTAFDFAEAVLGGGDPSALPDMINEMVDIAENKARAIDAPILLVGISLGALVSLNILRRLDKFDTAVMVTGGDIVKVAQNIYGHKVWPQSYEELAAMWQSVNMYSPPKQLAGKHVLFVLPKNDKLIDPEDVHSEVCVQKAAGNHLILLERSNFGHIGTIIEETILFPRRVLDYIRQVS